VGQQYPVSCAPPYSRLGYVRASTPDEGGIVTVIIRPYEISWKKNVRFDFTVYLM
jgi:hypothetical protein